MTYLDFLNPAGAGCITEKRALTLASLLVAVFLVGCGSGSSSSSKDSDGDGLTDAEERQLGTNPLRADSDGEGLSDYEEVITYLSNPLKGDTDGEGLNDYREVKLFGTNPLVADTDGDTYSDKVELDDGTDPLNTYSNIGENEKLRFTLPYNLSRSDGHAYAPSIATDSSGNPHIVYHDNVLGGMEVFYTASNDFGDSYSEPIDISASAGVSQFAKIAISDDDTIHIVYKDNVDGSANVFYVRKAVEDTSFSSPVNISAGAISEIKTNPDISVGTGLNPKIVVGWYAEGKVELAEIHESDTPNTPRFYSEIIGDSVADDSPMSFAVYVDAAGNVHATYAAKTGSASQIRYNRVRNGVLEATVQLSNSAAGARAPKIAQDGNGRLYVTWTEYFLDREEEIMLTWSDNSGDDGDVSFSTPVNVSDNQSVSVFSDIDVLGDGTVAIIWQDTAAGNYETVIARSSDRGETFEEPINFMPSEEGSLISGIAVNDQDQIFVTVDDNRFGPFEAIASRGQVGQAAVAAVDLSTDVVTPDAADDQILEITAYSTEPLFWNIDVYKKDETEKVLGRIDERVFQLTPSSLELKNSFTTSWDPTDSGQWAPLLLGDEPVAGAYYLRVSGQTRDRTEAIQQQVPFQLVFSTLFSQNISKKIRRREA